MIRSLSRSQTRRIQQTLCFVAGVGIIVFAWVQEFLGLPIQRRFDIAPDLVGVFDGRLVAALPKFTHWEKYGKTTRLLQDGRPAGSLAKEQMPPGNTQAELTLGDKTVTLSPAPDVGGTTAFSIVLTPDFTRSCWLLILCGSVLVFQRQVLRLTQGPLASLERRFEALGGLRQNRVLTLGLFSILSVSSAVTDKIPQFGWDGVHYAKIADRGMHVVADHEGVLVYHLQRVAPALIAHGTACVLREIERTTGLGPNQPAWQSDLPFDLKNFTPGCLMLAFSINGILCLTAAAWSALCVFDRLGITARRKLTGFVLLFGSFMFIRLFGYYPNLSDYYGFALGVFACHAYLADRRILLLVLAVVGAYTFPTASVVPLALLAVSAERSGKSGTVASLQWLKPWRIPIACAVAAGAAVTVLMAGPDVPLSTGCVRPLPFLLPVSIACSVLYLAIVAEGFVMAASTVRVRIVSWLAGGVFALVVFAAIQASISVAFGRDQNNSLTLSKLINVVLATSSTDPACFLGAHLGYFGLLTVLIITQWRGMWREAARHGASMCLLLLLMLALAVMSESRCLAGLMPVTFFLAARSIPASWHPAACLFAQILVGWLWLPLDRATTYLLPFGPWNEHGVAWFKVAVLVAVMLVVPRDSGEEHGCTK